MNENRNMTKSEAALARAEKALAEAREASARTEQAIDRAQEAIDRFWANQEKALARMRGEKKAEQAEEKAADSASCECSCKDSVSRQETGFCRAHAMRTGQIDPDLLIDLVAALILLAGKMDEQLQAIEKRTRRQRRTRHSAGRFVPPAF